MPEQMRGELHRWFSVMASGHNVHPRSKLARKPRSACTSGWSLPALHCWAAAGHTSLREITPEDVTAALPESGNPRAAMGQGLRCLFRILKAHRMVFLNPLNKIRTGNHQTRHPMPLPAAILGGALNSADPAQAALTALVASTGCDPVNYATCS